MAWEALIGRLELAVTRARARSYLAHGVRGDEYIKGLCIARCGDGMVGLIASDGRGHLLALLMRVPLPAFQAGARSVLFGLLVGCF